MGSLCGGNLGATTAFDYLSFPWPRQLGFSSSSFLLDPSYMALMFWLTSLIEFDSLPKFES